MDQYVKVTVHRLSINASVLNSFYCFQFTNLHVLGKSVQLGTVSRISLIISKAIPLLKKCHIKHYQMINHTTRPDLCEENFPRKHPCCFVKNNSQLSTFWANLGNIKMSQIPQTTGHSLGEVCEEFTRLKFHPSFLFLHHKPGRTFFNRKISSQKENIYTV